MSSSAPLVNQFLDYCRHDDRNIYGTVEFGRDVANTLLQVGRVTVFRPSGFAPMEGEFLMAFIGKGLSAMEMMLEVTAVNHRSMTFILAPGDLDLYVKLESNGYENDEIK